MQRLAPLTPALSLSHTHTLALFLSLCFSSVSHLTPLPLAVPVEPRDGASTRPMAPTCARLTSLPWAVPVEPRDGAARLGDDQDPAPQQGPPRAREDLRHLRSPAPRVQPSHMREEGWSLRGAVPPGYEAQTGREGSVEETTRKLPWLSCMCRVGATADNKDPLALEKI